MAKFLLVFLICIPTLSMARTALLRCTNSDGSNLTFREVCLPGQVTSEVIQKGGGKSTDVKATYPQKMLESNVKTDALQPKLPAIFKIIAGNFTTEASVDNECVYKGQMMGPTSGPSSVQLSTVAMSVNYHSRSDATFHCKNGLKCALVTYPGSYDLYTKSTSKPYLAKTSSVTVSVDFTYQLEAIALLEKLQAIVKWCQQVPPSSKWKEDFEKVR